jgi:hypothetical protein
MLNLSSISKNSNINNNSNIIDPNDSYSKILKKGKIKIGRLMSIEQIKND